VSFSPGVRVGGYEIISLLGAGGMGEVYRARDTQLGRIVAVKVLPDALASDADRIARFEREARALAALNHPHVATLFGLDRADGRHLLVMELVEGDTLADRLRHGPLPVEEALRIALQIADALEAAHERGIVHRDLKPANVKLTADGAVKVLDFGLAKALDDRSASLSGERPADVTHSPTLSFMATQAGVILGTAAYMSPEQAKGLPADQRSDVFSFGVVLFEMLTGRQPFQGETAPDVLASVLVREPDLAALPRDLNRRLVELVKRCLEKNPKRRWQAVGDVRADLETISAAPRWTAAQTAAGPPPPLWRRTLPIAAAVLATAALTAATMWTLRPRATPATVARFRIPLPESVVYITPSRQSIAIAPDGSAIALGSSAGTVGSGMFVHTLADNQTRAITGGDSSGGAQGGATNPIFSPDGRWVAFFTGASGAGTLRKVAVTGGAPMTLCQADTPFGGSWADGQIVFATATKGIVRVSENGGPLETLVPSSGSEIMQSPRLLPGGDAVLYSVARAGDGGQWDRAQVVAQSLKTGQRKILIDGGADARYVPTGHIVYALGGVLFAARFNPRRLEIEGGPIPVVEGVRRAMVGGAALFDFSSTGVLTWVPGPVTGGWSNGDLSWTDKTGRNELLNLPPGQYETPRVSPDGRLASVGSVDASGTHIWVVDLSGTHSMRRLTFAGKNAYPVWSADGQRLAFQSDRDGDLGIFWQRADGAGTAERLTRAEPGVAHVPESWSPDGQHLLFSATKGNDFSLWTFALADRKTEPFAGVRSGRLLNATFSPDGRWVAYGSDESGTDAVYVQPFPATGAKYQISRGDVGHHPVWSRDGKQLFYIPGPGRFVAVSVTTQPSLAFSAAVPAPRGFTIGNAQTNPRNHDIAPDGRFLGIVSAGQAPLGSRTNPPLEIVINWFEELKRRVPEK
jgi:serine/threonine-protein kinase